MKIAIPVKMNKDNPALAALFGKAKWFAIIEGTYINIVPNTNSGGQAVAKWLKELNVDSLIIQEIGQKPYLKLKSYGTIDIYHAGFERILLHDILEKFKANTLELLDDERISRIIQHHEKKHPIHE